MGAAQVRACALLRETASTSPRPSHSAVPALQIRRSRFFFPWLLLSLFPLSAIREVALPANSLKRFSALLGTRQAHQPLTKVRLRTSRRAGLGGGALGLPAATTTTTRRADGGGS